MSEGMKQRMIDAKSERVKNFVTPMDVVEGSMYCLGKVSMCAGASKHGRILFKDENMKGLLPEQLQNYAAS